jgi:hypothetical protein
LQEEKPEVIASGFSGKKLFGGSGAEALRIFLIAAGDMRGGGERPCVARLSSQERPTVP